MVLRGSRVASDPRTTWGAPCSCQHPLLQLQVQMGSWTWYMGTLSHSASYLWERCHHSGGLPSGKMLQEVPGQPGLFGEDIAQKLHHWLQLPWATQHQALTLVESLRMEAPQGAA